MKDSLLVDNTLFKFGLKYQIYCTFVDICFFGMQTDFCDVFMAPLLSNAENSMISGIVSSVGKHRLSQSVTTVSCLPDCYRNTVKFPRVKFLSLLS